MVPDLFSGSNTFAEVTETETISSPDGRQTMTVARNEILIYLDDYISSADHDTIAARIVELGGHIVGSLEEMRTLQVRVSDTTDEMVFATSLMDYAGFVGAGRNFRGGLLEQPTSMKRASTSDDAISRPTFDGDYWIEQIGADEAWKYTQGTTGETSVIGVVDTGIPAFPAGGPFGSDRLTRFNNGGIAVLSGELHKDTAHHGTYVACMAAAKHAGGVGVAWNNKIVAVDTFHDGAFFDTDTAEAIKIAIRNGANIVNISISAVNDGVTFPQSRAQRFRLSLIKGILYAKRNDVLVVQSAGNRKDNAVLKDDDSLFPNPFASPVDWLLSHYRYTPKLVADGVAAWSTHTLIVASVGNTNAESEFSFMGEAVNIAAPGQDVGCGLHQLWPPVPMEGSGTSYAAPLVTGTAALMRSAKPELKAPEIRSIILRTATPNVRLRSGSKHPNVQLNSCMAVAAVKEKEYSGDTWPNFGTREVDDVQYEVGKKIMDKELPKAICHSDKLYYSLSYDDGTEMGSEVPGLNFDLNKRVLSGTPTEAGTYRMKYGVWYIDSKATPPVILNDELTFNLVVESKRTLEIPESMVGWMFDAVPASGDIVGLGGGKFGGSMCTTGQYQKTGERTARIHLFRRLREDSCDEFIYTLNFDDPVHGLSGTYVREFYACGDRSFNFDAGNTHRFRMYRISAESVESELQRCTNRNFQRLKFP